MIISLSIVIFLLLVSISTKFNEMFRNICILMVIRWWRFGFRVTVNIYTFFIYFKRKKIINSGNVIILSDTSSHNAIDPDTTRPVCLNDKIICKLYNKVTKIQLYPMLRFIIHCGYIKHDRNLCFIINTLFITL